MTNDLVNPNTNITSNFGIPGRTLHDPNASSCYAMSPRIRTQFRSSYPRKIGNMSILKRSRICGSVNIVKLVSYLSRFHYLKSIFYIVRKDANSTSATYDLMDIDIESVQLLPMPPTSPQLRTT